MFDGAALHGQICDDGSVSRHEVSALCRGGAGHFFYSCSGDEFILQQHLFGTTRGYVFGESRTERTTRSPLSHDPSCRDVRGVEVYSDQRLL